MRSACLLFILVIAVYCVSDSSPKEQCPPENCLANSSECEIPWLNAECDNSKHTCCSVVKAEFRTACRHHGGECRPKNYCTKTLQRPVIDCPGQVCCVLV